MVDEDLDRQYAEHERKMASTNDMATFNHRR